MFDCAESYTKRMFGLLVSAYSTISVADTAHFLGMTEEDATNCMLSVSFGILYFLFLIFDIFSREEAPQGTILLKRKT